MHEEIYTLKRDNGGIKWLNSVGLVVTCAALLGFGYYMTRGNPILSYTVVGMAGMAIIIGNIALFTGNSGKTGKTIMKLNSAELEYYPLPDESVVYKLALNEIKDIHVLWWGNGTNKVTINFAKIPEKSNRIEDGVSVQLSKPVIEFERLDVSHKDFHEFFSEVNKVTDFQVVVDKR
ncbi:hypothetical protein Q2T76_05915 [Lactobacillus sp. YT155]|uniref:hypothetical protein n=1 Tax=Lactobacillus sp. YT155 TaxID=3060955 RepID=UPI00265EF664|nr:hypothetical protein [Lactobacillus sp. YT155]MDO1605595.1 hypothetical protein [Lactobacillus sp. YT155]